MAKLLPSSNSAIVKYQKSAVVKPGKFLNAKTKTTSVRGEVTKESPKLLGSSFSDIEKKVIQIDKLLKDSFLLSKKEEETKRKGKEKNKFEGKEKELESKKPPEVKGIKLPSLPKMGFLGWIKNFITQTILGFFAVRLIEFLPQLLKVLPVIIKVSDFFIDVGGKLLDGLVTFIDWGYKAYDATRGFAKNLFGESGVKQFDQLSGLLNKFLNLAIIAGMVAAGAGGRKPGRGGGLGDGRPGRQPLYNNRGFRDNQGFTLQGERALNPSRGKSFANAHRDIMKRYFQRFGRDKFIQRFGEEGLEALPGGMQRGLLQRGARSGFMKIAGKGGAKAILGTVRPFLKKIPLPVVGALIDFGLSVALGENPGRAAFRAIGAGLLGAVGAAAGSVVPFAGNFIGGLLGGYIGDTIGGALYDAFFGGGVTPKKQKGIKAASGGKASKTPSRTIKKKKKARSISFVPRKIKPGANAGGEDKVQKLFPNPDKPGGLFGFLGGLFGGNQQKQEQPKKSTEKSANPQEFLIKSNDVLGRTDFFGPFFTLAIKTVLGQKPDALDYKNAGRGLNTWMQSTFKSGTMGFAGGGEVDIKQFFAGEDYSDIIAKSVENSVSKEVDETIRDLAKELSLRPVGREEMIRGNMEKAKEEDTDPNLNIDMGQGGTVTGGNADFWTLAAIASLESGTAQGRADVAQSIYNRVASKLNFGQKSNTIKGHVIAPSQYQPVGDSDVSLWAAISDKKSAIAALNSHKNGKGRAEKIIEESAAAIKNASYQKSAAEFVGGRTDFWATGIGDPGGIGHVIRHGHRFGWFSGPAAIAYGRKNPGPAKAPQLGDIVVTGRGGGVGGVGGKNIVEIGKELLKQKFNVAEHPDFSKWGGYTPGRGSVSGDHKGRGHYEGRAIDVTDWTSGYPGRYSTIASSLQKNPAVKMLIHDNWGFYIDGKKHPPGSHGHPTHLHVETKYETGGETLDGPHIAMVGEKGREYVLDNDSYESTEKVAPGLLDILNYNVHDKTSLQKNMPAIISSLSMYTDYEMPYGSGEVAFIPIPALDSGGVSGGTSKSFLTYDYSTIDTMGEQMSDSLMYG
jgi:hypothetical protein